MMGKMTARQVIERERECVARQQCNRDCAKCDLVMEADDILAAYDHALNLLKVEEKTGMTPEDAATIGRFREHIFSVWSYAHMAEIAKAESEGRLIVLPCGDEVELEYKGLTYKADHWNPPLLTAFADCPTSPSGEKVHLFSPEDAKTAIAKRRSTMAEKEYIEREAIREKLREKTPCSGDWFCKADLDTIPAADVRPVVEVNAAVDEALRVLNALNGTGRLDYGDYCEMFDAIEAIKSVDKQEVMQK